MTITCQAAKCDFKEKFLKNLKFLPDKTNLTLLNHQIPLPNFPQLNTFANLKFKIANS
jgi:hypothetical protein